MPPQNPGLNPACPACGRKLEYVTSMPSGSGAFKPGDTINTRIDLHHYKCSEHGNFHIGKDGVLYPGP